MESGTKTVAGSIRSLILSVVLGTTAALALAQPEPGPEAGSAGSTEGGSSGSGQNTSAADDAVEICDKGVIDNVFKAYERQKSREEIKRVQILLRAFGYDPGLIDGKMGDETDSALVRLCLDYKVDDYLKNDEQSKNNPQQFLVKHMISLLNEPGPIDPGEDVCGCSRDFSAMVYGFYPYLLAQGEAQNIDFSLFDRIGFNLQVLDKEGNIPGRLQWNDEHESGRAIAKFIHTAHKHRVQVDLTFYASDWNNWKQNTISNAVNHIAETAGEEFHESDARMLQTFTPQRIDGINLYFDQYKPADSTRLIDIVENLAEELKAIDSAPKLNIILDLDWRGLNNQHFGKLKDILVDDANTIDKVFVFLTKDTSTSKKKLRQIVENTFHGDERKKVLRKIVPIIKQAAINLEPLRASDKGNSQFDDDLVYLKDNYAGIGLWPLASRSEDDAAEIRNAIIKHYRADDGLNYLGEILADYAPGLCEFVCPNRIWFYLALGMVAGIAAIYALLALWNCRLREIYRRNFIYFIVLFLIALLVLVISMVCDPSAEKYVDRIVIGILLLVVVGYAWRSIRKAVQPPLP